MVSQSTPLNLWPFAFSRTRNYFIFQRAENSNERSSGCIRINFITNFIIVPQLPVRCFHFPSHRFHNTNNLKEFCMCVEGRITLQWVRTACGWLWPSLVWNFSKNLRAIFARPNVVKMESELEGICSVDIISYFVWYRSSRHAFHTKIMLSNGPEMKIENGDFGGQKRGAEEKTYQRKLKNDSMNEMLGNSFFPHNRAAGCQWVLMMVLWSSQRGHVLMAFWKSYFVSAARLFNFFFVSFWTRRKTYLKINFNFADFHSMKNIVCLFALNANMLNVRACVPVIASRCNGALCIKRRANRK